jgi:hypothetical protein
MDNYGFALISSEEAIGLGLPNGTGMFDELYNAMVNEVGRDKKTESNYGKALAMTAEEKKISFLNRYFAFRKVRKVNEEKVMKIMMKNKDEVEEEEELEKAAVIEKKPVIRKISKKTKIKITDPSVKTSPEEPVKFVSTNVVKIQKKK